MNPIYCKYSNDRDPRFQIKTVIKEEEQKRYIYKYAENEEALPHIHKIYENYQKMQMSYKNTSFEANHCEKADNYVCLEYIEGNTLEDYLDRLYLDGKYLELIQKMKEYRDSLYQLEDNIPFSYTADFERIFGKESNFKDCKSLKVSNIDLIFANLILNGERKVIVDYEWTFDFPVPIDFIVYRSVYYYVHGSTKRHELTKMNIFKILGISDQDKLVYERMEYEFQKYVAGDKVTMSQLKDIMLKRMYPVLEMDKIAGVDYLQIYFDFGQGYCEENSVKKNYCCSQEKVTFEYLLDRPVYRVRIDLAKRPILAENVKILFQGNPINILSKNGIEIENGFLCFENDSPRIETDLKGGMGMLEVEYTTTFVNKSSAEQLKRTFSLVNEKRDYQKNKLADMAERNAQIMDEKNRFEAENVRLNVENQAMTEYLNCLRSKKIWRMMSITKRGFCSLKNEGLVSTVKKGGRKVKHKLGKEEPMCPAVVDESVQQIAEKTKFTDKKKILVVVHETQKGGATLLSLNIIKTIKTITEYEPIALILAGGPMLDEFRNQAVCYELNQPDFKQIYDRHVLNSMIRQFADLGICHAICNSVVTGLVLRELSGVGIKTITMVHELPTSIYAYDFVEAAEAVREYSDSVVFPAEFVKERFLSKFPIAEEKCYVMPQGVFSPFNSLSRKDKIANKKRLVEKLGTTSDKYFVLGCGYGNFRKGLDWFGQIAIRVMKQNEQIEFIWLGDRETEFYEWVNNDLMIEDLRDRFHWLDYTDDAGYIFGGADIFALTSREDPFPCVVQDAMKQYTPVFAFEHSGGIPEILGTDKGVVIPYGDCDMYAEQILALLDNEEAYATIAEKAKAYINNETPRKYLSRLLNILCPGEERFKKQPDFKVSVVIPNYNYENYIPERLFCILNQSILPYEIIFLDDVSKDNSVQVARSILENSGIRYQIIENETNQGCFRQWLNGIKAATGDIIWIAEADDACELDFIERLLPFFEDDQVNLAYAQSEVIYENNEHSGFVYTEYTKDLSEIKWKKDYVNDGEAEIIDGLGIKNTIPNASGVLMRKSALEGMEQYLKDYAISGDWFAYVYAIRVGKIAFCRDVLNYHRRHGTSIIHQREQDIKLFEELMQIKLFIAEQFMIPESIRERFVNHVRNEYKRLMSDNVPRFEEQATLIDIQNRMEKVVSERAAQYDYLQNNPKKRLLFVMPDFEMGGGQTLVVRLANYFSKFHEVYLYNARPWLVENRIVNMISGRVKILESNGDPKQLRNYIQQYQIETINCHIWWADKITYQAAHDLDVRIVLSMHGCYEALLQNPDWDVDFTTLSSLILQRANEIIYATDKNKKIFETVDVKDKTHQIYYGYELESIPVKQRETLGIANDSFVFGLVARGIRQKGFGEAVEAFKILREKTECKMDLILIGNGEFIDELKMQNKDNSTIHFVDNLQRPSEWIGWVKTFDCALLPTYYISESLPNSVIEYLAYGKPVISTDIGDIRYMLVNDKTEAGIVLKLQDNCVNTNELAEAMNLMITDKSVYQKYQQGAKEMFSQFDIRNFAENYYVLYEEKK